MNINLDYKVKVSDPSQPQTSNQELTFDYINYAVNQKHKDGLDGALRRIWGRIQRKFDTAVDGKAESIELEQGEKDFIKKCFDSAKYPPMLAKYVDILEDEIAKM